MYVGIGGEDSRVRIVALQRKEAISGAFVKISGDGGEDSVQNHGGSSLRQKPRRKSEFWVKYGGINAREELG